MGMTSLHERVLHVCLLAVLLGMVSCRKIHLPHVEPELLDLEGDLGVHDPAMENVNGASPSRS